ncbi:MAG: YggT family protein [Anaerolineaceae bacterium]
MTVLLNIINFIGQALSLLVILHTLLGYFLAWDHPVRQALDRIVSPMLRPIRNLIKPVGGLDFSPFVLILLIYLLEQLLSSAVLALFR